jgi:hypothetical protein
MGSAVNGWWAMWYQNASTDITSRAMLEQWLLYEVDDETLPYVPEGRDDDDNSTRKEQSSSSEAQHHDDHENDKRNNNNQSVVQQKIASIWKRGVQVTAGAFSLDRQASLSGYRHEQYFAQPISK